MAPPPNVQMQIYRMVQEAVSNIWRHAGATHVKMTVDANPGGDFVLRLQDNGRDFDPSEQRNLEGRGLANMRARASLIAAEISWEKALESTASRAKRVCPARLSARLIFASAIRLWM